MHSHPSPKFSVITVTYNAEKVLEDTVQSVISQTYHRRVYHHRRCIERRDFRDCQPIPQPHQPIGERTGQRTL